jgi:hypothetical protein
MNKKLLIESITKFVEWHIDRGGIESGEKYWLEMKGRICPVNDSCSDVTGSKCASDAMEVVTCSTFHVQLGHMATGSFMTLFTLDGIIYPGGFRFVPPRDCGNSLVAKVQSAEGLLTFVLEDLDPLYAWTKEEDLMDDNNENSSETYKLWNTK